MIERRNWNKKVDMMVTDHPFKDLNSRKETAIRTDKGGVFFLILCFVPILQIKKQTCRCQGTWPK